jgi:hypothetical protein
MIAMNTIDTIDTIDIEIEVEAGVMHSVERLMRKVMMMKWSD